MNSTESIPQAWDDERDGRFFQITASLFTPSYCCGASVLLASYDIDDFSPLHDTDKEQTNESVHSAAGQPSDLRPAADGSPIPARPRNS